MEHDPQGASIDALMSLQEIAASGRADIAALIAKFRAQRRRARRLNKYCDEIFTEIGLSQSRPLLIGPESGAALVPQDDSIVKSPVSAE
jgi:hypothetical protein